MEQEHSFKVFKFFFIYSYYYGLSNLRFMLKQFVSMLQRRDYCSELGFQGIKGRKLTCQTFPFAVSNFIFFCYIHVTSHRRGQVFSLLLLIYKFSLLFFFKNFQEWNSPNSEQSRPFTSLFQIHHLKELWGELFTVEGLFIYNKV